MQHKAVHYKHTQVKTTCPYCGVGCGLAIECETKSNHAQSGQLETEVREIKSLNGDQSHPANFGKLCVKGSHLLETLDSLSSELPSNTEHLKLSTVNDVNKRLLKPKVNNEDASWDDALHLMSEKIKSCLSNYGPESVAFYLSGQLLTEDYYVANKLMKGFIGSANVDTNSRLCMSSAVAAYKRAFGADAVPCCYEDLEHTELLVLVGSNAAWTHPVLFQRMQQAIAKDTKRKLLVIDPRKTATSQSADLHLAIKPGTDTWLFNGLLHFLIEHKACDYKYIQDNTQGFNEVVKACENYTLESVASTCELDRLDLLRFYTWFAESKSTISFYSMGVNQSTSGVDKANAIINCHLASGKIGKKGSGPFSITGQPNAMGGREVGGLANMLAAHMDIENPEHQELVKTFWEAPNIVRKNGQKAVDMFDDVLSGKIKFIWIMGTNPVVSMPNRRKVEAALAHCETVVVSDLVQHNDTLAFADIKLPATGWSEKNGTVTNSERRISRQRGLLSPTGNAKHDWQIICELAAKLGFKNAFNFTHPHQIFVEHARLSAYHNGGKRCFNLSGLTNLTEQQYDALTPVQWPVILPESILPESVSPESSLPASSAKLGLKNDQGTTNTFLGTERLFTDNKFYTSNQKAIFIAVCAQLPYQRTTSHYPYVLNSGRMRDQWHTMTRTGKAQKLVEHSEQAELFINPKDAAKHGLRNGEYVTLMSESNAHIQDASKQVLANTSVTSKTKPSPAILPIKISQELRKGELFVPIHWSKSNTSHVDIASLYSSANDPISGQPELKHAAVNIKKITPTDCFTLAIKASYFSSKLRLAEYQININQGDFYILKMASFGQKKPLNSDLIKQYLPANYSWLSCLYADTQNNQKDLITSICLSDKNELVACLTEHADTHADGINNEFIKECFAQQAKLDPLTQHQLLTRTVPSYYEQGRLICSCFNVREKQIQGAIDEGCESVYALGEKLKCGTNCGSCKSELSSLLQHAESRHSQGLKTDMQRNNISIKEITK
ncbi:nitrate reductase [Glaciecola petra]|uniref:Nitrate reductase n=1 Tax=Glaciecola petra TaxID=3075602 RepID=A0ABU2ZSU4_9ALTE|nr:nitrate reductase [Aestuariibacter sp. P117]MDT0595710.1 nitrate reductase [Aestuariibacter sp. P117]